MENNGFIGRPAVLDRLLRARDAGKLGQPFLLIGPEGSGKENTALEFARLLNCADPDHCVRHFTGFNNVERLDVEKLADEVAGHPRRCPAILGQVLERDHGDAFHVGEVVVRMGKCRRR